MTETNWRTRAIDSAADLTKQVLTLSTGVLTLTLTFYNNFFGKPTGGALVVPTGAKWSLGVAWLLFYLFDPRGAPGAGQVHRRARQCGRWSRSRNGAVAEPTVNEANTMKLGVAQWMLFLFGMIAIALGGGFVLTA